MDYGYEVRNKVRWITDEKLGKKDTIICLAGSGEFSLEDDIEKAGARMDKERAVLEAKVARIKERDAALDETLAKVSTIKGRLGWLMGDMEDTTADDAAE
jgi:hypothetical protein